MSENVVNVTSENTQTNSVTKASKRDQPSGMEVSNNNNSTNTNTQPTKAAAFQDKAEFKSYLEQTGTTNTLQKALAGLFDEYSRNGLKADPLEFIANYLLNEREKALANKAKENNEVVVNVLCPKQENDRAAATAATANHGSNTALNNHSNNTKETNKRLERSSSADDNSHALPIQRSKRQRQ